MENVKGFLSSKINWTQLVATAAMVGAMFGLNLDAETQAAIVGFIVAGQALLTIIFRTWFTSKKVVIGGGGA